ncbi:hypothetical protein ccbrp13_40900 [Ktedonobacteria bacterium brp13]|nr:hypothetical protein ccbrp13_40900 [Ktedonobacteria bacterium brp13]
MAKTKNENTANTEVYEDVKKRKKLAKKEAKLMLQIDIVRKEVVKARKKIAQNENTLTASSSQLQALEDQLAKLREITPDRKAKENENAIKGNVIEISEIVVAPDESYQEDKNENFVRQQEPAEGREDISEILTQPETTKTKNKNNKKAAKAAKSNKAKKTNKADKTEENDTTAETASTPIEDIPVTTDNRTNELTGEAVVHSEIALHTPEETEATKAADLAAELPQEDLTITSGEGSIDILNEDEHAWPPAEIREELVEGIAKEVQKDEARAQEPTYRAESTGGFGNPAASEETASEKGEEGQENQHAQNGQNGQHSETDNQENGKQARPARRPARRRRTTTTNSEPDNN